MTTGRQSDSGTSWVSALAEALSVPVRGGDLDAASAARTERGRDAERAAVRARSAGDPRLVRDGAAATPRSRTVIF